MSSALPHITVCICTFRRPEMLRQLLESLQNQKTADHFSFSIVVTDNDDQASARPVAEQFLLSLDLVYCVEARKNIAIARNTAVAHSRGDFIAFIDDDEFPPADWLRNLLDACLKFNVSGVLAPVLPFFGSGAPAWIAKSKLFDRPRHTTGFTLDWQECRTGNVLLRRSLFDGQAEPFNPAHGTGGEDQDFFRRMIKHGHQFIWCDEAPVHEHVPPQRWDRKVLLSRALLRGKNSLRHDSGKAINLLKSLVAFPCYSISLPFLRLCGEHYYVRYLIKTGDHVGRLLAALGLNPVEERKG